MATWSSALVTALKIVIVSIIWVITGLVLISAGFMIMGLPKLLTQLRQSPGTPITALPSMIGMTSLIMGGVVTLIGYGILLLGIIATFLKYSAEYYASEIEKRRTGRL